MFVEVLLDFTKDFFYAIPTRTLCNDLELDDMYASLPKLEI